MDKSKVLKQLNLVPDSVKQKEWDAKETVEGAQAKADKALQDAKQFMQDNTFTLNPATNTELGGVKVGTGLSVTPDGTLTATELKWANVTEKPEAFKPETHQHKMTDVVDYVPPVVDDALNNMSTNSVQNKIITAELEKLKTDVGNLLYKQIVINSFSNNKNVVEMGSTITDVIFNWTLSKEPKKLMLESDTLDNSLRTKTLSGQTITSNRTFTLKATDERDYTATKTTGITFLNGVYNGVASDNLNPDSQFVLQLSKKLQSNKASTFTVNAGAGQFIYFAVPSRYGACSFNVGGFDGGFTKVKTIDFTNASGYMERYDVYKSDNENLGNTTVKVS